MRMPQAICSAVGPGQAERCEQLQCVVEHGVHVGHVVVIRHPPVDRLPGDPGGGSEVGGAFGGLVGPFPAGAARARSLREPLGAELQVRVTAERDDPLRFGRARPDGFAQRLVGPASVELAERDPVFGPPRLRMLLAQDSDAVEKQRPEHRGRPFRFIGVAGPHGERGRLKACEIQLSVRRVVSPLSVATASLVSR